LVCETIGSRSFLNMPIYKLWLYKIIGGLMMDKSIERRREERLRYQWPVLYAEDFTERISYGVMVDVSSGGIAFTCSAEEGCPEPGQELKVQFSIPRSENEDDSAVVSITRKGRVCRVDEVSGSVRCVALQFDEPLSLKPCEQAHIDLMNNTS